MIIIKIDCCGHPQMLYSLSIWMLSDAMQAKGLTNLYLLYLSFPLNFCNFFPTLGTTPQPEFCGGCHDPLGVGRGLLQGESTFILFLTSPRLI